MAKQRRPEREQAYQLYAESKGKLTARQIAERLKVSDGVVRNWKSKDRWDERRKKRGGAPRGNQNAKGNGAPKGNTNAETHGAYSEPRFDRLTPEQAQEIQRITAEFEPNAVAQLKRLLAKQADLEQRIQALDSGEEDELYLDRVMTMDMPDGGEIKYRSESSAFSRRMLLEAELNRVQGRIIKLLDSLRGLESERHRMQIERDRLEFNKQKAMGIFSVPDEQDNAEEIEIVE